MDDIARVDQRLVVILHQETEDVGGNSGHQRVVLPGRSFFASDSNVGLEKYLDSLTKPRARPKELAHNK